MKVSILLAVYNGEKYLEKSLVSLINQTYQDIEILVGFNGTTDRSKEIVSRFNDSRIRVFDYQDDKGKAKTLNKLLKEARGEWIAIQDDDDIWFENKLESQIPYCNQFDVIGTQIKYINDKDEVTGGVALAIDDGNIKKKSLTGDNQIANTSAIVKKDCIVEINGWRTDVDGIEDFDLWLRLMRKGYKFLNLEEVKVFHRLHVRSNFNTQKHDLSLILDNFPSQQIKKNHWKKFLSFFRI